MCLLTRHGNERKEPCVMCGFVSVGVWGFVITFKQASPRQCLYRTAGHVPRGVFGCDQAVGVHNWCPNTRQPLLLLLLQQPEHTTQQGTLVLCRGTLQLLLLVLLRNTLIIPRGQLALCVAGMSYGGSQYGYQVLACHAATLI
jgi:hypothetical protein